MTEIAQPQACAAALVLIFMVKKRPRPLVILAAGVTGVVVHPAPGIAAGAPR
ncbi:MAG: hypothetical protein HY906_07155 [Deltaproteobacteria bacterium]|nr:hypothetical protein [Deltaproteobacteria bacterium]